MPSSRKLVHRSLGGNKPETKHVESAPSQKHPLKTSALSELCRAPWDPVNKPIGWMSRFPSPSYATSGYFDKSLARFRFAFHPYWRTISVLAALFCVASRWYIRSITTHLILPIWVLELWALVIIIGYILIGTVTIEVHPRGLLRITYGGTILLGSRGVNRNPVLRWIRCVLCHYLTDSFSNIELIAGEHVSELETVFQHNHSTSRERVYYHVTTPRRLVELSIKRGSQESLPVLVDGLGSSRHDPKTIRSVTIPVPHDGYVTLLFLLIHGINNHTMQWPESFREKVRQNLGLEPA